MSTVRTLAALTSCLAGCLYGQPAAALHFEVAAVKPSKLGPNDSSGMKTGHGQLDARNVTVKRCIMGAYGVGPQQIQGGPDWLASDSFDILAKAATPTDDDAVLMQMLQGLLADRFKLALRRESKSMSAYVLETAKGGARMEKSAPGEAGTNTSNSNKGSSIEAHNTSMDLFSRVLSRELGLPVVNRTELEGIFNFKLSWIPDRLRTGNPVDSGAGGEGPSIFTAIQEQLGLHIRAEKIPVEILVIDHVEKPSEN